MGLGLEVPGLVVGAIALPPVLIACIQAWQMFENVSLSAETQNSVRVRLNNQKIFFRQWAQRVGLLCHVCFDDTETLQGLKYVSEKTGRLVYVCSGCNSRFTRIEADKQRDKQSVQAIRETLRALRDMFQLSEELAAKYGFGKEMPKLIEAGPSANVNLRKRDHLKAAFGVRPKAWESEAQSQSSTSNQTPSPEILRTLKWAIIDDTKFRTYLDEIKALMDDLEQHTQDIKGMRHSEPRVASNRRAMMLFNNWFKDVGVKMKIFGPMKKQRMLLDRTNTYDAVGRVTSMYLEDGRKPQPVICEA